MAYLLREHLHVMPERIPFPLHRLERAPGLVQFRRLAEQLAVDDLIGPGLLHEGLVLQLRLQVPQLPARMTKECKNQFPTQVRP